MTLDKQTTGNRRERGNALFLILIAVALFAALSYAITQSGRGGGTINSETDLITAGQVVEQPAAVRTAVTRMVITGTAAANITFTGTATSTDVFSTSGGGATILPPPVAACKSAGDCAAWTYVAAAPSATTGIFIFGVGTAAGGGGGDGLAVLQGTSGLTSSVCSQIQKGLGFTVTTPVVLVGGPVVWGTAGTYLATGNGSTVKGGVGANPLDGQAFACIQQTGPGVYGYYHTLIES